MGRHDPQTWKQVRLGAAGHQWNHAYDAAGRWVGRYDGGWLVSGVFHLGGRPLGLYYLSQTYFVHADGLGSTSMNTDWAGNVAGDILYYPWGQVWAGSSVEWHFAGFEYRDPVANFDPTLFRQYANVQGRWMSPDPLAGDVTNPQSLNRYAYMMNNPCSVTDPLGLDPCSFNINIVNAAHLGPMQLGQVQDEIARVFGTAGLGVAFGQQQSDYNLTISPSIAPYAAAWNLGPYTVGNTIPGSGGIPTTSGYVYVDRAEQFASSSPLFVAGDPTANLAVALGRAGSHEIGHGLLQDPNHTSNSVMEAAFSPSQWFSFDTSTAALWQFTSGQAAALNSRCNQLHPQGSGPVPSVVTGGGAGISPVYPGSFVDVGYGGCGEGGCYYLSVYYIGWPGNPHPGQYKVAEVSRWTNGKHCTWQSQRDRQEGS